MSETTDLAELERSVEALAVALFAAGTVEGTMRDIVALATDTVDGCDAAGVLLVDAAGGAITLASNNELALEMDQAQIDTGEGPCMEAATSGVTVYSSDLRDEDRWPAFTAATADSGIRCVLALSLSAERLSALNLFGKLPAAFGATDRAKGQLFATLARLALDSAHRGEAGDQQSVNLHVAMQSRELIGQAQGILMERERITSEQAFDVLRRASQHLNIKLSVVAERLVDSGESPDPGPRPAN